MLFTAPYIRPEVKPDIQSCLIQKIRTENKSDCRSLKLRQCIFSVRITASSGIRNTARCFLIFSAAFFILFSAAARTRVISAYFRFFRYRLIYIIIVVVIVLKCIFESTGKHV